MNLIHLDDIDNMKEYDENDKDVIRVNRLMNDPNMNTLSLEKTTTKEQVTLDLTNLEKSKGLSQYSSRKLVSNLEKRKKNVNKSAPKERKSNLKN